MATENTPPANGEGPAGEASGAGISPGDATGAGGGAVPPPADAVVEGSAPQPDAVFIGTVLQTGSSSVAEVEPAADTVVVRVDQVVSGAPAFHDHLGEPITVALPEGVDVAEGDVHVFRVTAWIFGTGLAVQATSVGDQDVLQSALASPAGASDPEERVRLRMASADRVVSGVVRQVSHVPAGEDHPITEHDPLWQDAVVEVHGHLAQAAAPAPSDVTVRFASSRDVNWHDAPKFSVGERGIWVLGAPQPTARAAAVGELPADHYLVVHPDDVTPAADAPTLMAELDKGTDEQ
jgi:hypothetical protein